ncbi:MAG: VWA domain-containing protein, partial [Bacteroidota bacterium]
TTGLSWYLPSQERYVPIDIPGLQSRAKGRFINAFLHRPTKTLFLSFAEKERKNIYVCQSKNPSATWLELRWQAPLKLPEPLNSDFDDTTPFLDEEGSTLYFASNRPGGYGKDDIYFSRRLDQSWLRWSAPENLGFRVNSNFSEIYYCLSPASDYAYFVSYKHSYGSGDIFRLRSDSSQREEVTTAPLPPDPVPSLPQLSEPTELTVEEYKANNLVFLIDRSASMRASSKLPLLQASLKRLIGQLRDIDGLTLMSFADTALIHFSTQGVIQKDSLYQLIDSFVAAGGTKANRGLQLAYDYTKAHFLEQGNNEIILVTDGRFDLSEEDQLRINANQNIVLSVVGLGSDRKAITNLRKLTSKANGSFIHLKPDEDATEALLEEVKARSRQ